MTKYGIFLLVALFWSNIATAQEHVACHNLDYEYQKQTLANLRAIAASCKSREIAQLYYNRAYHRDLLSESEALSQITTVFSQDITRYVEAYRLYIALIEAFAPNWYPDEDARAAFLNREYDNRSEVAELRLHGYDRLADSKERNTLVH